MGDVGESHTTGSIGDTFLARLLSSPEGRRRMLSISVDAEEGDEAGVFDQLARCIDDPDLRRVVLRHRDDELRHASMFRGCLARLGLDKEEIPGEMRIIREIASGADPARRIETADDIVRTYATLLAIEERGVERFPRIAEAFAPHDAETAEVYLRVARDERGHVRYCNRIGRHYAHDDAAWDEAVAKARAAEEAAFVRTGVAAVVGATEAGLVDMGDVLPGS
ncbi:MAG TPA: ferritin-like domain-containing protein [Acidimicrobiales bacterium]|nr:ferritin-like domain-containing protein [Acidimicrobiales bacterium]